MRDVEARDLIQIPVGGMSSYILSAKSSIPVYQR